MPKNAVELLEQRAERLFDKEDRPLTEEDLEADFELYGKV